MGRKKKDAVVRCWVCGVPATRSMSSEEHVCDNPVCEQVTKEHIAMSVAIDEVNKKEEKFREGEHV